MIDDIARPHLEEFIRSTSNCSAAAGWRADQQVIKQSVHLRYNSDYRGAVPFRLLRSGTLALQIPVLLTHLG